MEAGRGRVERGEVRRKAGRKAETRRGKRGGGERERGGGLGHGKAIGQTVRFLYL